MKKENKNWSSDFWRQTSMLQDDFEEETRILTARARPNAGSPAYSQDWTDFEEDEDSVTAVADIDSQKTQVSPERSATTEFLNRPVTGTSGSTYSSAFPDGEQTRLITDPLERRGANPSDLQEPRTEVLHVSDYHAQSTRSGLADTELRDTAGIKNCTEEETCLLTEKQEQLNDPGKEELHCRSDSDFDKEQSDQTIEEKIDLNRQESSSLRSKKAGSKSKNIFFCVLCVLLAGVVGWLVYRGDSSVLSGTRISTEELEHAKSEAAHWLEMGDPASRTGLIQTLIYREYSPEAAVAAVDSLDADWNQQAVLKAKERFVDGPLERLSRNERITSLITNEGFTVEQAVEGVEGISEAVVVPEGLSEDVNQDGRELLNTVLETGYFPDANLSGFTKTNATAYLILKGIDPENAARTVESIDYDWKKGLHEKVKTLMGYGNMESRDDLFLYLLFAGFTPEEALNGLRGYTESGH